MSLRRVVNGFLMVCALAWLSVASLAMASEYHGVVTFGGLPLPGTTVTVTATQGDKKVVAISDEVGTFSFADLADGTWAIDIEMTGFAPLKQDVTVAPNGTPGAFEMKLLSLDEIRAEAKPVKAAPAVSVATVSPDSTTPAPATATGKTAASKTPAAKGAATKTQAAASDAGAAPAPPPDPNAQASNDGFLINGSVNNAATSQYSMSQAFGNARGNGHSLYNGGVSLVLDSSALDARNYSLTGLVSPKDEFNNLIGGITFGGPLKIPHLLPRGPNFYVSYQRTQSSTVSTPPNLVPTLAEVGGNLSGQPNVTTIYVPSSLASNPTSACYAALIATPGITPTMISAGTAQFANNTIPAACISPTAQALLAFYPQPDPNLAGNLQYNYQVPLDSANHSDAYRLQMNRQLGSKNNMNGSFIFQDTRSSSPSIFVDPTTHQGFSDKSNQLNLSTNVSWYHRFTQRLALSTSYSFSRSRSQTTPYFEGRTNVSGNVGINGNLQDAADYGPPGLGFSSGISGLGDSNRRYNRNETNSYGAYITWNRGRHNVQIGTDFRRQEYNYLSQSNPRGSLQFTGLSTQGPGAAGGSDFADFLLGLPDTSAIAYGNADKYLRQSVYDGYANDDFRVNPELSINGGIRWDYGAPVTELKGRLVNLNTGTGFTTATPVLGSSPTGVYPTSLIRPDKIGFAPIIGIAWRPISGSSLLVRAGYGLYHDTSLYQQTASAMAQQAPLSTSVSVAATNTNVTPAPACPFTIAITQPFLAPTCASYTPDTFAVDPNFRVGYSQSWNLSVQRDLPFALQMVAGYLGIKGTRSVQEFLPNTYPIGTTDPYGAAPAGYYYRTSGGNSTREQGSVQLRRRLRNGFQANLTYTYSKSLDDAYALGGQGPVTSGGSASPQIAQDWTNPSGQRGLSTFDQRHVMNLQMQYTTGMGIGGHTLMSGWRALAYKEWTVLANFGASTGLPETPIDPAIVPGTAFTGSIRGNYLGGPIHIAPKAGIFLNQAAFSNPVSGWGNARRDSITGPGSFTLNASMDRTFRLHDRYNLETRLDATNILNHVAYSNYNTTVGTSQFGAVTGTGGMRSMQITMRLRY